MQPLDHSESWKTFNKYGITAPVPSEINQKAIYSNISPNLEDGTVVPEDMKKIINIAGDLA